MAPPVFTVATCGELQLQTVLLEPEGNPHSWVCLVLEQRWYSVDHTAVDFRCSKVCEVSETSSQGRAHSSVSARDLVPRKTMLHTNLR